MGFISNLAPLLNYLRIRSPAPPFRPLHQAGERGAETRQVAHHETENVLDAVERSITIPPLFS